MPNRYDKTYFWAYGQLRPLGSGHSVGGCGSDSEMLDFHAYVWRT